MSKITGIKSVDFKITASGNGVVNWNGSTALMVKGKEVENHTLPKLRGYTNLTGKVNANTGRKQQKEATDIDFKKTPLYISQNCIRHHLFRDQAYDLHFAKRRDLAPLIASITGLMRGFVVPSSQCKRDSALLIEDFVDELGNGNFEQFVQAGPRDSSSFFSKTTFGGTQYTSYGSISLEKLQFISLDSKFDRAAMNIKEGQGEEVAQQVQDFIQSLNPNLNPEAVFHENYVRGGTIFEEGEKGILLNQDAMQILVDKIIDMLKDLSFIQAGGNFSVDEIELDYNDSNKELRFKNSAAISVHPTKDKDFAVYFYAK